MIVPKKIIACYILIILIISSFGCIVKLHGAEVKWAISQMGDSQNIMENKYTNKRVGKFYFFGVYNGLKKNNITSFVKDNIFETFRDVQGSKNEEISNNLLRAFYKAGKGFSAESDSTQHKIRSNSLNIKAMVAVVDTDTNELFVVSTGNRKEVLLYEDETVLDENRKNFHIGVVNDNLSIRTMEDNEKQITIGTIAALQNDSLSLTANTISFNEKNVLVLISDSCKDKNIVDDKTYIENCLDDSSTWLPSYCCSDVIDDGDEEVKLISRKLRNKIHNDRNSREGSDNLAVLVVKLCPLSWTKKLLHQISIDKNIILGLGVGGVVVTFYCLNFFFS